MKTKQTVGENFIASDQTKDCCSINGSAKISLVPGNEQKIPFHRVTSSPDLKNDEQSRDVGRPILYIPVFRLIYVPV